MQIKQCVKNRVRYFYVGMGVVGLFALGIASCNSPERRPFFKTSKSSAGWPRGVVRWRAAEYPVLKVDLPKVEGAQFVNDDSLCATCHETYVKKFEADVHREQKCEGCHGPASRHLETRGKEPGLILSLKTLPPAQRSEVCLKCHEQPHEPGERWRTSVHAHKDVTCTDCHKGHYNVPAGTPATELAGLTAPPTSFAAASGAEEASGLVAGRRSDVSDLLRLVSDTRSRATASPPVLSLKGAVVRAQEPSEKISLRGTSNHMGAVAPQVCYKCHAEMRDLEQIAHPHQVGGKNGFNCTTCHDTHGKILEHTRKDLCLECHKGAPTMAWHSSTHNLNDVACTDCHNPHPKSSVQEFVNISHTSVDRPKRLPMSVDEPVACYKCHPQIYAKNSMPSLQSAIINQYVNIGSGSEPELIAAFQAELTNMAAVEEMFRDLQSTFGGLDILVNSASIFSPSTAGEATPDDWDAQMNTNAKAPFFTAQHAARLMLRRGQGKIVNIADVAGEVIWTGHFPYSVSKAALIAVNRGLAKAYAPQIQVNAIAPGPVLFPDTYTEEQKKSAIERTLLKRGGSPQDIVNAVVFLIENDYITGELLHVDGGRHIL